MINKLYPLIREALFQFDPELSHLFSMQAIAMLNRLHFLPDKLPVFPVRAMGLEFPNPIGLAAGLDKNAEYIEGLAQLGFGFIEVGTVTPRPQSGNPKPRIFRLPKQQAVINRLGFNNKGVDYLIERLQKTKFDGILGINIGKQATTPIAEAVDDYLYCLRKVYQYASYIVVNVSSPNTPNLRQLQLGELLESLLVALKQTQLGLANQYGIYKPIVIKLSPDLEDQEIKIIAQQIKRSQLDGIIATNTTINHESLEANKHIQQTGGLSGLPLKKYSLRVLKILQAELQDSLPIIGVGGIMNGQDGVERIQAGASLLQIYTGFIYRGPALITELVEAIRQLHQMTISSNPVA